MDNFSLYQLDCEFCGEPVCYTEAGEFPVWCIGNCAEQRHKNNKEGKSI